MIEGLNDNGAAAFPQVAMGPDGNAVLVWQQWDGAVDSIASNRYTPNDGLGDPVWIERLGNRDAASPQVAMDPGGNAVVVWQQLDLGPNYGIASNRYTLNDGWVPTASNWIERQGNSNATTPQVAMDPSGNAVAVWQQLDAPFGVYGIGSNRYNVGWDPNAANWIERADINNGDATTPQVAMDPDGNAVAVWQQRDGFGVYGIGSNRYTPSGGWVPTAARFIERADINNGDAISPQVAMDGSGNAVAVWQQRDGFGVYGIGSNRYTPSGGWDPTAARFIERTANPEATAPQVAMDPDGNAVAVWQQREFKRQNRWNIGSNRYTNAPGTLNDGWGTAAFIPTTDDGGNATKPQVAIDVSGNAVVVWEQEGTSGRTASTRTAARSMPTAAAVVRGQAYAFGNAVL